MRVLVALLAALLFASVVSGDEPRVVRAGAIVISDAWTRPTAAGMPMGVAYLRVRNEGASDDAIVSASTPAAARVEIHQTTLADGMARMRPMREILVPAKGTVAIAPGGIHLMLVDMEAPIAVGTRVPLVLQFRRAGRVATSLAVESRTE